MQEAGYPASSGRTFPRDFLENTNIINDGSMVSETKVEFQDPFQGSAASTISAECVIDMFVAFKRACPREFEKCYCAESLPELLFPFIETAYTPKSHFMNKISALSDRLFSAIGASDSYNRTEFVAELENRAAIPGMLRSIEHFWDPLSPSEHDSMMHYVEQIYRREMKQGVCSRFAPIAGELIRLCVHCLRHCSEEVIIPVCNFGCNDLSLTCKQLNVAFDLLRSIAKWRHMAAADDFERALKPFVTKIVNALITLRQANVLDVYEKYEGELVQILQSAIGTNRWMGELLGSLKHNITEVR